MVGSRQAITRSSLVTQAIQNTGPTRTAPRGRAQPASRRRPSPCGYFSLRIFPEQYNKWSREITQLQAGQRYRIVVTISATRMHRSQKEVEIGEDFELQLNCQSDGKTPLALSLKDGQRSYKKTSFTEDEWLIEIPADTPICQMSFSLAYKSEESNHAVFDIATCTIDIDSQIDSVGPQLLKITQLEQKPPEHVMLLVVNSHPDEDPLKSFQIHCWQGGRSLQENAYHPAIVNVSKLMQRQDQPLTILGKIRLFSQNVLPNFKQLLEQVHSRYQEQLSLIIVDMTELEIPWELFESQEGHYLGAITRIVRWIPPRSGKEHQCPMSVEAYDYEGSALAYLDTSLGNTATDEYSVLKNVATHYPTLADLEMRLHQSLNQVSLIYVGCHGQSGSTLQQQEPDALSAAQLVMIDKHEERRPLVFINACESGRIVESEWGDSSFVEIFLQRCAGGYIGTLGRVGTRDASYIAGRMLALARQEQGLLIAEILRQLRAEAIKQYKAQSQDPALRKAYALKMLYTFMYIYYGNPQAVLRLKAGTP